MRVVRRLWRKKKGEGKKRGGGEEEKGRRRRRERKGLKEVFFLPRHPDPNPNLRLVGQFGW